MPFTQTPSLRQGRLSQLSFTAKGCNTTPLDSTEHSITALYITVHHSTALCKHWQHYTQHWELSTAALNTLYTTLHHSTLYSTPQALTALYTTLRTLQQHWTLYSVSSHSDLLHVTLKFPWLSTIYTIVPVYTHVSNIRKYCSMIPRAVRAQNYLISKTLH